jgi:tetratricopeptide (TPR) repeat protein
LEYGLATLPDAPSSLRACALAFKALLAADEPSGLEWANAAVEMARGLGDLPTLLYALLGQQWARAPHPPTQQQIDLASELIDLAREAGDRTMTRVALFWRAAALIRLGDPAAFADIYAFHETSTEMRVPHLSWTSTVSVATAAILKGEFAAAEHLAAEAFRIGQTVPAEFWASDIGQPEAPTNSLGLHLFAIRREQGRADELMPLVQTTIERFPDEPAWQAAAALIHLEAGNVAEARALYSPLTVDLSSVLSQTSFFAITLAALAEDCVALDDSEHAGEIYRLLADHAGQVLGQNWSIYIGSADRLLGNLQSTLCEWRTAEPHFLRALQMHERLGSPPWLARTQWDYARMLQKRNASDDRERARALLHRALATAREIGMAKVAIDCETMLATA